MTIAPWNQKPPYTGIRAEIKTNTLGTEQNQHNSHKCVPGRMALHRSAFQSPGHSHKCHTAACSPCMVVAPPQPHHSSKPLCSDVLLNSVSWTDWAALWAGKSSEPSPASTWWSLWLWCWGFTPLISGLSSAWFIFFSELGFWAWLFIVSYKKVQKEQ